MIADETVARVRDAADLVAIVQQFGVPLRKSGGTYRGPCPFHGGKNNNFAVTPKLNAYHCFVCHEKGDVFAFVQKKQGLDFVGAVKLIGDIVGIEVVDAPRRAAVADPNEPHWETVSSAAEWFRAQLAADGGQMAREYLASRDIDTSAQARFGIGYAPRDGQKLRQYLHDLGFDDARQRDAGVLVQREGDAEPRSNFRHRVMFPIVDEFGHPVGFGGRALGEGTPKYLNSAESAVFQKRRTLYGMHTARQAMRKASRAIVVEGYFDVIRLALAGFEEAVAPLGTALTDDQATLLSRYASEAFLLYDSDAAGQKATFRSGVELLRHRVAVRVVSLPDHEDPDTYVRAHGSAAMDVQLMQAIDLFDRQVQMLERRGWFSDLRHQRRAIDKLLPTIRAAADPLSRDQYLTRLSEVSGLDKATLAVEADSPAKRERRSTAVVVATPQEEPPAPSISRTVSSRGGSPQLSTPYAAQKQQELYRQKSRAARAPFWQATQIPPAPSAFDMDEQSLIRAMLVDAGALSRVQGRRTPAQFRVQVFAAIFRAMIDAGDSTDHVSISELLAPDLREQFHTMANAIDTQSSEGFDIGFILDRLAVRDIELEIEMLNGELFGREAAEQDVLLLQLTDKKRQLLKMNGQLGKRHA